MSEKKEKEAKEPLQKFEIKKHFATEEKIYEAGDYFYHNNKKVIEFLKFNNII